MTIPGTGTGDPNLRVNFVELIISIAVSKFPCRKIRIMTQASRNPTLQIEIRESLESAPLAKAVTVVARNAHMNGIDLECKLKITKVLYQGPSLPG